MSLFIDKGDKESTTNRTTLEVDLTNPPNWETFVIGTNITSINITNGNGELPSTNDVFAVIGFAIQSHGKIESIHFGTCSEGIGYCLQTARLRSLEFIKCSIDQPTAILLKLILSYGLIQRLCLEKCVIGEDAAETIKLGLCTNTSLEEFQYDPRPAKASLMGSVTEILKNNKCIKRLRISMQDESIVQLCEAATWHMTLQSIQILSRAMDLDCVSAIVVMLRAMRTASNGLKELTFNQCSFSQGSMALLLEGLSKTKLLPTLKVCNVTFEPADTPVLALDWAALQVESLNLDGTAFDFDSLSAAMNGIANNPCINELSLFGVLDTAEKIQLLCDTFLLPNHGPSDLNISNVGSHAPMIISALQRNTSMNKFTIADFDKPGLVAFAQGLGNMAGLCQLQIGTINEEEKYSAEFFAALHLSMQQNTSLKFLTLCSKKHNFADMAKPFLPTIEYLLALNRVDRASLLKSDDAPLGIWPHVLASEPVLDTLDLAFMFLAGKPDIIVHQRPNCCKRPNLKSKPPNTKRNKKAKNI